MQAGRPKVCIWSLQMTTDLPLTWCKVAELSQTQNNYLSLESVFNPRRTQMQVSSDPVTHPLSAAHPCPGLPELLSEEE